MRSGDLFETAKGLMPGGVSSPVRAFAPHPRYVRRAKGSVIEDVDGNSYVDYCMAFGPLILGHAHPHVVRKLAEQLEEGVLYGAPIEKEILMAKAVRKHYPSIEMVRIVSSGTEATMSALRVARGYTGRNKVVKIEGSYHGAHDALLVKAGSGATTFGVPTSMGIPAESAKNTLIARFNDIGGIERLVKANRGEVAAVITEPVIGNAGVILPREGYLRELRELTERNDILLILDEVITGFRLAMGGAQEHYGVRADITTLGKIAGGGMPIGMLGGRRDIMEMITPAGKVYQAGTFSGNPMSLTAGLATIEVLEKEGHERLNARGARMCRSLGQVLDDLGLGYRVNGIASMFQLFFTEKEVWNYEDAKTSDIGKFDMLFRGMLERGIYLPPSQFETNFLSTAHSDGDVDRTLEAYGECLRKVG